MFTNEEAKGLIETRKILENPNQDLSLIGTRISVNAVLSWFANGMTPNDIIEDYQELTLEQIQACLAYAADREHKVRVAS